MVVMPHFRDAGGNHENCTYSCCDVDWCECNVSASAIHESKSDLRWQWLRHRSEPEQSLREPLHQLTWHHCPGPLSDESEQHPVSIGRQLCSCNTRSAALE